MDQIALFLLCVILVILTTHVVLTSMLLKCILEGVRILVVGRHLDETDKFVEDSIEFLEEKEDEADRRGNT